MRRLIPFAIFTISLAAKVAFVPAQANPAPGFAALFNGKDLSGWKAYNCQTTDWQIKDGVLRTTGTGKSGWLVTEAEYSDFVLKLDYRLSVRANSGVALRAPLEGELHLTGMEVQIQEDDSFPNYPATLKTGAICEAVPRSKPAHKPVGEWNQMEITAKGFQMKVSVNGTTVLEANLNEYPATRVKGLRRTEGHIGLQTYGGTVEFRNIEVKSLASSGQITTEPLLMLDAGGHTDGIHGVAFTPNGTQVVSGSRDKTVRVWDVKTGTMVRTLRLPVGKGVAGVISNVAVSPNGEWVAVAREAQTDEASGVYLLRLQDGRIERIFQGHVGTVRRIVFSPDGKQLAAGGVDKVIRIWQVETGAVVQQLRGHLGLITDLAYSPDSRRLVSGAVDNIGARIWNIETGKGIDLGQATDGKTEWARKVGWSADGQTVATGSNAWNLFLWNTDGTLRKRFGPLPIFYYDGLFFTPNSQQLVVQSYMFDLAKGQVSARFNDHLHGSFQNVLSPDGTLVATGGYHGDELSLWKTTDGSLVHRLRGRGKTNWSAGFGPDGTTIAWGNTGADSRQNTQYALERSFRLTDLEFGGKPDQRFERVQTTRDTLTFERVPPAQGSALLVKERGQTLSTLKYAGLSINCWTLLPGRESAVVSGYFGLYQFNIKTGEVQRSYRGHTGDVRALAVSKDGRYFLSASSDQTLRVWNPDRAEPLLSLYFAGDDWIAWTPEGYYAASPGGEKLMGWQVNNGTDRVPTFYPAAQFHKTLYRPDVIKKLLEAGSVDKALVLADKERGQRSIATEVAQVLPPKVAITFPEKSGQKLSTTKFEVKTSAASVGTQPVTSLRLLVDGRPYGGEASLRTVRSAKVGEVRDSWQVDLPPGPHRLAVVAASAVSQSVSDEIEIFVSPSTTTKPPTANLHLLAVGINAYPGRLKLDCAVPDAKAITSAFTNHSKGLYQVKSTLLLDKEATRANLLKGIATLEKQAKAGDVVIVYYAGHGDCKLAGQFVMLTIDATVSRDKLAQTGVTGDEVKARLARLPCTVLLIMDCCYAGSFDAPAKDAGKKKRSLPTEAGDLVRELVNDDHGLVVMCGASKEQESGEEAKLGHGYFTQSLIECLGGKAASKRDGVVYLTGLQLYVEERVRELSSDEQYPTIGKPTLIRSFPLSKP